MNRSILEDALILHNLNDAIAGVSDSGLLIYDYKKTIKIFMDEGMEEEEEEEEEEAEEWVDYNVMGVQCNGEGFIMMYDRSTLDIEEISS